MLTYRIAKRNPEQFQSLTGLSIEEFESLYDKVKTVYQSANEQHLSLTRRRRKHKAGRKFRHNLKNRLLLFLTWLRVYASYRVLGLLFNLDKSNICRNIKKMLPVVQKITELSLPDLKKDSKAEDLETLVQEFPQLRAIVDATEQRIRRPNDADVQKEYYSGKKKAHTQKTQIVINQESRIYHVSTSVPGKKHDLTLERESKINELLPLPIKMMGDKGYQGLQDDNPIRIIELPLRKPKGTELTTEQKEANSIISKTRIFVEHVIAHIKIFQILYQVYRHPRHIYNRIFRLIAGLVNLHKEYRLTVCASP